nr:hypothetical protein [Tanacetum cinerariifolium]
SAEDSFNLNTMAEDEEEEEVLEVRPMSRDKAKKKASLSSISSTSSTPDNDEALARLLLNEFTSQTLSFMTV